MTFTSLQILRRTESYLIKVILPGDESHWLRKSSGVTLHLNKKETIMKSVITFAALAFIVIAVSCKKDNSNFDPALAGSWKINSFVDNGNDKTNSFAPYTLTFDSHGGLSIDNGSMNYMCGYTKDNNIYHFNMMGMDGGSSMEDLDDDWMLNDINDSTCTFVDDNPSRDCTFTMQRL